MGGNNVLFSDFLSKKCSLALTDMRDGTLAHHFLRLQTSGMLRWHIFSCTCKHAGCYAGTSSLALANIRDVTLAHFERTLSASQMDALAGKVP